MPKQFIMLYFRYRLLFSNWKILIISLILPLFLSYSVGFLFKDYSGINSIPIGIINEDTTKKTEEFISQIEASQTLTPIIFKSKKSALSALDNNKIEAIFTIKKGFASSISSGKTKKLEQIIELSFLENNLMAGALGDIFARNIIRSSSSYIAAQHVKTITKSEELYNKTYSRSVEHIKNPEFALVVEANTINSQNKSPQSDPTLSTTKTIANRFAIGMTLAITAFYMMYIGASTIEERKKATFYRIYISGNNPNMIIFAAYTSFASIVLLLQLLLLNLSLNIFLYSALPSIIIFVIGFCSSITGLALFISSMFENSVSYQSISMTIVFFICLFGGAFWSLELIPANILWLKSLSPVYWILEFLLQLSKKDPSSVLPSVFLTLIGIIITHISSHNIKNQT